jgi:HEAT repeat protein
VRQAALWALEELKDARPAVIDGMLRALAFDKAWPVRRSAIWVLRTLGDTTFAVVEGLVRALTTDTDETVRRKAIEMLRDIRAISPLAVPGLLWAVGTEKVTSIRYAVFDVLVNCEGDRSPVIDGLIRILRTSDSFPMREKAAVALRDAESSPAVIDALLHAVTTDINVSVRRRAASSLAAHAVSSARAFDVLLEALITVEDGRAWEDAARFLRTTLPTLTAAKRSSVEAVVARMESASQVEGKHCGQCPRCGWSYAWNGSVCGHCNFRLQ